MYHKGKKYSNKKLFKIRGKMIQKLNTLKVTFSEKKELSKVIKKYMNSISKKYNIPVGAIQKFLELRVKQHLTFMRMIQQDLNLKKQIDSGV